MRNESSAPPPRPSTGSRLYLLFGFHRKRHLAQREEEEEEETQFSPEMGPLLF